VPVPLRLVETGHGSHPFYLGPFDVNWACHESCQQSDRSIMVLLKILGILFLALIIIIPLVDRFGKKQSDEEVSKISRWILPLVMLLAVLQLVFYMVGK